MGTPYLRTSKGRNVEQTITMRSGVKDARPGHGGGGGGGGGHLAESGCDKLVINWEGPGSGMWCGYRLS